MRQKLLNVYLYEKHIGTLYDKSSGLEFQYNDSAYPLSIRMPVSREVYKADYTLPFFQNLLPEGDALALIANKFHISKDNIFSILKKIGGDCSGAVSLYSKEAKINVDSKLKEIDNKELIKIIDELPSNPLLIGVKNPPRLSLAGAQHKFAVYRSSDGRYYRSDDIHPTTHIIKIANKSFSDLLENEFFCMTLAGKIFDDAVEVNLKSIGNYKYLEIQRYDRREIEGGKIERLHQEDFCQVLGYLSIYKYQSDGGPKIKDIYNALRYSDKRVLDIHKFIKFLIFNYLIGNTDAHAKNFSFLYKDRNDKVVLSPPYDLLSIDIYPAKIVCHDIAMIINGKGTYKSLLKRDWEALFNQLDLSVVSTIKTMKEVFSNIIEDANKLADTLNKDKLTSSDIYQKIISNIETRYHVLFD